MKNLTNLVSLMKNLTIATITMGNVKGVLKKIQNVTDIKKTAFIYSSDTGIRVSRQKTNIHILFNFA